MAVVRRVPPGRAGRLWLKHRLAVAERGADLLDQKLRILHAERQRLALLVERTGRAWRATSAEAETWMLRASLLGGQRALRLGQDRALADVDIVWGQSMGVRYPAGARCRLPEPDAATPPVGSSALHTTREAHRRALQAAVDHAVAEAAVAVMAREEATTRRRLRAIENRWVPQLEEAARQVRLRLEEREHDEAVRLRWAARRRPRPGRGQDRPPAGGEEEP